MEKVVAEGSHLLVSNTKSFAPIFLKFLFFIQFVRMREGNA